MIIAYLSLSSVSLKRSGRVSQSSCWAAKDRGKGKRRRQTTNQTERLGGGYRIESGRQICGQRERHGK